VGKLAGNRFQEYIVQAGRMVGVDFCVNVVLTARRGVGGVYAGAVEAAFGAASDDARSSYATPCGGGYDVAVLNAYPKDLDVMQSYMALNVCLFGNEGIVREGGTVVVTTPAPDGAALHYLGGVGMRGYSAPTAEVMKGRQLGLYCPTFSQRDVEAYFPPATALFREWPLAEEWLGGRHGSSARAVVVECAALQLVATA
jgi:hypothetical protein